MIFMKELFLFLHVVLATFWVGGMLFLSLVVAPYLKDKPQIRNEAFQEVGKRFSLYGTFLSLFLLFVTGLVNTYLIQGGFRPSIHTKLGVFFVVVFISLLHDLWAGKKALYSEKHRVWAKWLGILNLILSLLLVYLGVRIRLGY
ncbi:putative protein [Aquifex aeolicus VF5]|uniref:Uncharacterized protein aq_363 n=2 Tax=Aquifex aeolicus TaxID=63363 RepID=Y363_AQUAE|nr:RecName: Full=Uncharacterized protein aq_363 [Aquifex aeolicus VF5]AAC06650.1 putative protein [Aquifex aeolicus VF5]